MGRWLVEGFVFGGGKGGDGFVRDVGLLEARKRSESSLVRESPFLSFLENDLGKVLALAMWMWWAY